MQAFADIPEWFTRPRPIEEATVAVPHPLAAMVLRALESDPSSRFADAREMAGGLRDHLFGPRRLSMLGKAREWITDVRLSAPEFGLLVAVIVLLVLALCSDLLFNLWLSKR